MHRGKDRNVGFGSKAAIAAKFDECLDKMTQLCVACTNLKQVYFDIDIDLAQQILSSLKAWGSEIGASTPSLDRRLRFNESLRDQTVDVLASMHGALQEGIIFLETDTSYQSHDTDAPVFNDMVDEYIDPMTRSQASIHRSVSAEILEILGDLDYGLKQLESLNSALRESPPTDIDRRSCSSSVSNETNDGSPQEHLELTTSMFPDASSTLIERLGRASWRRQLSLNIIRERKSTNQAGRSKRSTIGPKKAPRYDVAVDAFNFQRPALKTGSDHTPHSIPRIDESLNDSSRPDEHESDDSHPSPTIFTSKPSSVFSRAQLSRTASYTSYAHSTSQKPEASSTTHENRQQLLKVPQIPKLLDSKSLLCPFCGFELDIDKQVNTVDAWEEHVFEDLFTYLCTFEKCNWPDKTYGGRGEWHQHELRNHLIPKVWSCESCKSEFGSRDDFKTHLLSFHSDEFSVEEASEMVSFLRPVSSRKSLCRERCPLCPSPLDSTQIKEHIAEHLEQLALRSVYRDESTEDDESDELMSQSASDNMSERGYKLRFLQAFADEQITNLGQIPRPAEITDQDDLRDESDDEASEHGSVRASGLGDSARHWRVQKLMRSNVASNHHHTFDPSSSNRRRSSDTDSTLRFPVIETRTFPKDDGFKGREKELANLYKILSEPGRVYVLSAEGGMGKTALAVEFTYRYEQSFEYIFWVQAETPVGASETFNQIAMSLALAPSGTDQETLTKLGREFLESTKARWLMILDNVDKWDHIDSFIPMKTSVTMGSILITTRHQGLTAPSRPINYYRRTLEELTDSEGRDLLLHGLPQELQPATRSMKDPEFKAAGDLASLAGLPLIIVLITGYMRAMNCQPSEFSSYWDAWWVDNNPHTRAEDRKTSNDKLESIMKISVNDLSSDSSKVLRIMSFLDSDGVQKELLTLEKSQQGPNYLQPWRLGAILRELVAKHFLTEQNHNGKQTYIVHRSVQARILRELHQKSHQAVELFKLTVDLVRRRLPRPSLETPGSQKWNQFKQYLPHIATLQRIYSDQNTLVTVAPFLELAELFKDGGVLLWQRFLRNDAMRLLMTAERILDQLETSHEDLKAEIHVTMNLLLQYLGISRRREISDRAQKILEFHRRRTAQREQTGEITDGDKVKLINANADYANSMLQCNDFRKAEPIYKDCRQTLLKITSEEKDPFAFAKLTHHLAYCSMYRHDFASAEQLGRKSVDLIKNVGDEHLVLRFQFDLACIMLQGGDHSGALDLHERILADRVRVHGKDSYFTLQSQYAVGAIYSYMQRWDQAELQISSALGKAEGKPGKSVWPDAAVARSKFHLSLILTARNGGRPPEEAQTLARESKDVLSRLLVYDDIQGVTEEDTGALFDHLQPVFGGRWTGTRLLKYVS
ncbi:hypothetical protein CKAH01_08622 [Colletotrichum kahawae]|uniref:C2H2-type domain-containing protein n=1 Tax=Colletotrichum kahawae TaxID=34407 RepID=A0AAD9Y2T8_COLKA|nr:hypothetical protein CKAH01_08622 [Colletotrichum kahawae]